MLTRFITSRWPALVLALAIPILAMGLAGALGEAGLERRAQDALPVGSGSAQVAELRSQLPDKADSTALIVYAAESGKLSPEALGALQSRDLPGASPLIPSKDGTAALRVVSVTGDDEQIPAAVAELREAIRQDLPAGVTAQATGPAAIQADLSKVFDGANLRLLLATGLVVAVLLMLTYRSPILWLIPLLVVGIADRFAAVMATHVLKLAGVPGDASTTGILSVLVFGAGTNYALLLISRYRDELTHHEDRREAMRVALPRTAEAVIASASTVVVGVICLMLSVFPATRGLGLASAVGIIIAAAFVLVVLPAAMVSCGRWIFWPRVPRAGQSQETTATKGPWRRIANIVTARPAVYAIAALVALGIGAVGMTQIKLGLNDSDQFLRKPEAIAAAERLSQSFPAGTSDPTTVLTRGDAAALAATYSTVPGVDSVRPGASGNGLSELSVVLTAAPGSPEARETVQALRDKAPAETWVGGSEAARVDVEKGSTRDRMLIFPLVLVLVALALFALLRSALGSVLLVLTVVGTYAAALGLAWWSFSIPGFPRMDETAPLYAFVFLVALGVDYNIFLISRVREEARTYGVNEGVRRGLAATGGVITSAGLVLAAVFAVLGILPLVVLAQVGVIIGIGVLLDTLLVRTVLVPALVILTGKSFWWPTRLPESPRDALGSPTPEPVAS